MHPAVPTDDLAALRRRHAWARGYHFAHELAALCDARVSLLVAR